MSQQALDLFVLTYNCAHNAIDVPSLSSTLFNAVDYVPDLLIISLQEMSPLSHGLIGGSLLSPFFSRISEAVEIAARKLSGDSPVAGSSITSEPRIFTNVAIRNIGMTGIMAFSRDAAAIQNLQTGEVGLGVSSMGNKGGVGLRFTYADAKSGGETELTFVAAHLAAMEWDWERRNEDWKNIVRRLVFTPANGDEGGNAAKARVGSEEAPLLGGSEEANGIYKPTSHLFVAGDLNYRTSDTKPGPDDHKVSFPQPHDSVESPRHYSHLFKNDQLTRERLAGRTFQGLSEAPVTFPPTYKFDSGPYLTADEDTKAWAWASHRWPSWTDRVLFLEAPKWMERKDHNAKIEVKKYEPLPLFKTSDHRAVLLSVRVPLVGIPEPDEDEDAASSDPRINPPFEIDPDWSAARAIARKEELVVGVTGYLSGTWEGRCIIGGTIAALVGGYFLFLAAFGN